MAKSKKPKTAGTGVYVAQSRIAGLMPPSKNADGVLVEHVVEAGAEVSLPEEDAAPLVACGALKLAEVEDPAAE